VNRFLPRRSTRSVTPDYRLPEDGMQLKMLKRYIRTAYNLTPDQYRKRWGLPANYPMVASNYAKKRSKLAKAAGLGSRPRRKRA
jgi:predicted transcriptional regulator